MSKNLTVALLLIALTVLVLLFNNSGRISIDLLVTTVRTSPALAFLCFTGIGVVIGLLLRS